MGTCSSKLERNATSEEAACNPTASYIPSDIWGNVFVLNSYSGGIGIGSESIHFVSNDGIGDQGVYLSFEHSRYRSMTLRDGTPWPLIMPFHQVRWNANPRTFEGWVYIKKNYGSGVMEKDKSGAHEEVKMWYFWLGFDERFQRVISGNKRSYDDGVDLIRRNYGDDHDVTYYNAAESDPLVGIKGCTIDDAAYRGITLRQLLDVKQAIYNRCVPEKWMSTNPNLSNKLLEPEDVTLYDLVEHLIKPITKNRQCSFVEMIASEPQHPKWFVSHWWGEPVIEFIQCLRGHAKDRKLDLDTSYWICAYANNQWKADEEVGQNPKESSFYRAMKLSEGTVSILDRKAVCYTRIWCSYELYLSFVEFSEDSSISDCEGNAHLYDAYTIDQNEDDENVVVGLTDGPVAVDRGDVSSQAHRQRSFPLEIVNNALKVKIINAEASMPQDKTRILNSICENKEGLDVEAPANHVKYDTVDSLLRGRFASSMYRPILDSGQNLELIRTALLDAPLSKVGFSFRLCRRFRDEASKFALSIPKTLEYLDLDFALTLFHSSEEFAVGFRRLRNLKVLKLSLFSCTRLSCINNLGEEIGTLAQLIELDLNFRETKITECGALAEMLNNLSQLKILRMSFFNCTSISDVSDLAASLATMTGIRNLILSFCETLLSNEQIHELCRSVVKIDGLEYLQLDLRGIKSLDGMVREKLVCRFQSVEDVKAALNSF